MEVGCQTSEQLYFGVVKVQSRTGFVQRLESMESLWTILVGAFGRTAGPGMDGLQSSHTFRARRPDVTEFVPPKAGGICTRRWRSTRLRSYQLPTVDSVTIPYALMVRFCCICGAKIVPATQNPRIPRSDCRFDLWNPALKPQNHRQSDSAERSAAR